MGSNLYNDLNYYDFSLPDNLIARFPEEKRDDARLLIADSVHGTFTDANFFDLPDYFNSGDLLILNNTRVLNSRLYGHRDTGAELEILLTDPVKSDNGKLWKVLTNRSRRLKKNEVISLYYNKQHQTNKAKLSDYRIKFLQRENEFWIAEFEEDILSSRLLEQAGNVPLPPYIKRETVEQDGLWYQTVYSKVPGSVAAPTAGLHFTDQLFEQLEQKGVERAEVTLNVSYGTFSPVKDSDIRKHKMHSEFYNVSDKTAEKFNTHSKTSARIAAVGTTSLRVLQSIKQSDGTIKSGSDDTDIFIYPPFDDFAVNSLITNFHTPKSTLLMLISAFGGYEFIKEAYKKAVADKYRFFSYGDAMLILR